jgi:YHS domain-containing protein
VAALIWLARAIILLLILRFVLRLFFGGGAPARRPQARAGGPVERAGGELVRDPQCGTYVPKSRAIAVGTGTAAIYFCSATCRDAFDRRT